MLGIILVNKNVGVTSRDVVNDICHIFNTKKVGHTGTLDPIASGVLVITLGKATKLNNVLTSEYKEYIAEFKMGVSTDTLDITGSILKEEEVNIEKEKIINALKHFHKTYLQEVPIYSAVKVNGKKLYEYARKNESVKLPQKEVTIKEIELLNIDNSLVQFRCVVSKGTYIRSLIRDIGDYLNIPTTMTSLIRTKQGEFKIEDSYTIEDIKNNNYQILSLEDIMDVDIKTIDEKLYKSVSNGVKLGLDISDKPYILFKYQNRDICLYKRDDMNYRMFIKLED